MNYVVLMGRLTADPEVKYAQGQNGQMAIAKYTLAVDRQKQGEADFIRCTAFGKNGEFAEKYLKKGMKIAVEGRIQTGNYKDTDGKTVYTTDVIVAHQEFCEKKSTEGSVNTAPADADGFAYVADDGDLPFGQFN